jgi:uncharacterized protein
LFITGAYLQRLEALVNELHRKERRGFASMSAEKQREIASKGGRAAHEKGTAHEWTSDEARTAGRKGGQVSRGGRGRLEASPGPGPMSRESFSSPLASRILSGRVV